jgi:hypothetical protein
MAVAFLPMEHISGTVADSLQAIFDDDEQIGGLSWVISEALALKLHGTDWELNESVDQVNNKILLQDSACYNGKYFPCSLKAAIIATILDYDNNMERDTAADLAHSVVVGMMYLTNSI